VPVHRDHETVELLKAETPYFIPGPLWPPSSPDSSRVDYMVWSVMQEMVYQHRIKDVGELREFIVSAWDELDHGASDAVRLWQTRIHEITNCTKAKGDYFEHSLS